MLPEEDGVDDMTDPDGIVLSWEGDCEATRRALLCLYLVRCRELMSVDRQESRSRRR